MKMGSKNYVVIMVEVTSGLRYKNHFRIKSESYVRLALGSYIIKPCKWDQKITY